MKVFFSEVLFDLLLIFSSLQPNYSAALKDFDNIDEFDDWSKNNFYEIPIETAASLELYLKLGMFSKYVGGTKIFLLMKKWVEKMKTFLPVFPPLF